MCQSDNLISPLVEGGSGGGWEFTSYSLDGGRAACPVVCLLSHYSLTLMLFLKLDGKD